MLTFPFLDNEQTLMLDVSRKQREFFPLNNVQTIYPGTGEVIQIQVTPSSKYSFIDPKSIRLEFNLQADATPASAITPGVKGSDIFGSTILNSSVSPYRFVQSAQVLLNGSGNILLNSFKLSSANNQQICNYNSNYGLIAHKLKSTVENQTEIEINNLMEMFPVKNVGPDSVVSGTINNTTDLVPICSIYNEFACSPTLITSTTSLATTVSSLKTDYPAIYNTQLTHQEVLNNELYNPLNQISLSLLDPISMISDNFFYLSQSLLFEFTLTDSIKCIFGKSINLTNTASIGYKISSIKIKLDEYNINNPNDPYIQKFANQLDQYKYNTKSFDILVQKLANKALTENIRVDCQYNNLNYLMLIQNTWNKIGEQLIYSNTGYGLTDYNQALASINGETGNNFRYATQLSETNFENLKSLKVTIDNEEALPSNNPLIIRRGDLLNEIQKTLKPTNKVMFNFGTFKSIFNNRRVNNSDLSAFQPQDVDSITLINTQDKPTYLYGDYSQGKKVKNSLIFEINYNSAYPLTSATGLEIGTQIPIFKRSNIGPNTSDCVPLYPGISNNDKVSKTADYYHHIIACAKCNLINFNLIK